MRSSMYYIGQVLAIIFLSQATFGQESKDSGESISGRWNSPVVLSGGKIQKWNHEFIVEKDRLVMKRRSEDSKGEIWDYKIDPTKKPNEITMIRKNGLPDIETGKPHQINAIYQLTEKELRIAFLPGRNGSSREGRPKDLTSTEENRAIVMILISSVGEQEETRRTKD